MAQLEIQPKRSTNWLWWVLGLIILALILWWVLRPDGATDVVEGVQPAPVLTPADPMAATPAPGSAGAITDLSTLSGATGWQELVGRRVELTNVPVAQAVSDKGFWIDAGNGNQVFAVRTSQNDAQTAPDGAAQSGANVNVWGVVTAMPTNLREQTATWNLQQTDTARLKQQGYYIHVDSLRLANR